MSIEKSKQWESLNKKWLSWKAKAIIWWVALSTSVLLAWCGNWVPESNQAEYKMWKEVLISKNNGFEFYKWEPPGSPRQMYLVKYNPENKNDWEKKSKTAPQKIWENDWLELYQWEAEWADHNLYIVKWKNGVTTNWKETKFIWKFATTRNYSVTYQWWENKAESPKKINWMNSIQAWWKLSPEEQESLGLPRIDNPRIQALVSLNEEQRNNLWLNEEYNQLLKQLKK